MDAPTISSGPRSRARVTLVVLALAIAVTVLSAQALSIRSASPVVRPAAAADPHGRGSAPVTPGPRGNHGPRGVHGPNMPGAVAVARKAAASPELVLSTRKDEFNPAVSDGYLTWAQDGTTFVRPDGMGRIPVNPPGTDSSGGGIDGTTVVFAQRVQHHQDDLFLYDVLTDTISDPPEGINTSAVETQPSISGAWLLFQRVDGGREKVILFNLVTLEQRVVANIGFQTHGLLAHQVDGDWATWETCDLQRADRQFQSVFSNCQAFRYQISANAVEQLPNPGRQQYAVGVAPDGTAYLLRTARSDEYRCGVRPRIVRIKPNDDAHIIATLPAGVDLVNMFAFEEAGGSTTLYFDQFTCAGEHSDIYRIRDADTA
jgi:hypothetical protein